MAQQQQFNQSDLEKLYTEMFNVVILPVSWLPLPESMSLAQPSPYQVVPMVSSGSADELLDVKDVDE